MPVGAANIFKTDFKDSHGIKIPPSPRQLDTINQSLAQTECLWSLIKYRFPSLLHRLFGLVWIEHIYRQNVLQV